MATDVLPRSLHFLLICKFPVLKLLPVAENDGERRSQLVRYVRIKIGPHPLKFPEHPVHLLSVAKQVQHHENYEQCERKSNERDDEHSPVASRLIRIPVFPILQFFLHPVLNQLHPGILRLVQDAGVHHAVGIFIAHAHFYS